MSRPQWENAYRMARMNALGRAERRLGPGALSPQTVEGAAFWRTAEPVAADAWAEATESWLQVEVT